MSLQTFCGVHFRAHIITVVHILRQCPSQKYHCNDTDRYGCTAAAEVMITCLTHVTTLANLESILKTGSLMTTYERQVRKLRASGLNTPPDAGQFAQPFRVDVNEFPGIFLNFKTSDDTIGGNAAVVLVFGADLLHLQRNYHINLVDRNGMFSETLTYFPDDELPRPLRKVYDFLKIAMNGRKTWNEVVFHDSIPISLATTIYVKDKDTLAKARTMALAAGHGGIARRRTVGPAIRLHPGSLRCTEVVKTPKTAYRHIDRTSEACRVFSSDHRYTGIPVPLYLPHNKRYRYRSSLTYVKGIARTAGVSTEILRDMKTAAEVEAYMDRHDLYTKAFMSRVTSSAHH